MNLELLLQTPEKIFIFLKLLGEKRLQKKLFLSERRTVSRRVDRRFQKHRRTENISTEEINKRSSDRRDISNDKRRKDRRALERIKYT